MSLASTLTGSTLALLVAATPVAGQQPTPQPPRPKAGPATGKPTKGPISLEELDRIAGIRARRNLQAGQKDLKRLLQDLSLSWEGNRDYVDRAVDTLARRGPDLSPLLVPYLDPTQDSAKSRNLAINISRVLGRIGVGPLLEELVKMARSGKPLGRELAVELLGRSQDKRARTTLRASLKDPAEGVAAQACLALARQKDRGAKAGILELLRRRSDLLRDAVLRALPELGEPADLEPVLAATRELKREESLRLLLILVDRLGKGHREAILRLHGILENENHSLDIRLEAAGMLGRLTTGKDRETLHVLRSILRDKGAYEALRKQVAFTMNDLGDKAGHKLLLSEANRFVTKNSKIPYAYVRRGDIYFKLRLYTRAASDYNRAIGLCRNRTRPEPSTWIDLMRCYAHLDKGRDLVRAVKKSGLSTRHLAREVKRYPELQAACRRDPNLRKLMLGR